MSKGRKPLAMPRKPKLVYIRIDLLAKLDLLLTDPMRDKAKYGAFTEYFEQLIEADLQKRIILHPSEKEESA